MAFLNIKDGSGVIRKIRALLLGTEYLQQFNPIDASGNSYDNSNKFPIEAPPLISTNNSSVATLGIGGVFTGVADQINGYGIIYVNVFSDVASATDGLQIEQSSDGVNWDHCDEFTIPANTGKNFSINPHAKYMRVVYTNGAVGQSAFRLQTILKVNGRPSSHRIADSIISDDDAELVKAVLSGSDPNGLFKNVNTTEDGDLSVSNNSSGLAIAEGNVTGKTFVHKFGKAPDFDLGDGVVTIWDGANDALFSGSPPMVYTYSASDDIGTISSSNVGDTEDVEIEGLAAGFVLTTQTVTLNGQNDVALGTNLIRVFRMKNIGSSDLVGVVYLRTNGSAQTNGVPNVANTVRAIVNNGNNQTLMAVYTIPAGKTGYMRDWYAATAGANRSSNYGVQLFARPFGQVFQLKHDSAISDAGTSAYQHKYEEPEVFTEKTDIELNVQGFAGGLSEAAISGGFDIVLVDN